MAKTNTIAGLDIGTSNIKILLAERKNGDFEVKYFGQEPSFGVRRGVVINTENVSKTIQNILSKLRSETDEKIDSVYVNINGSHIFSTCSRGMVAVSRADQKVSKEDVERVIKAAETVSLPSNNEIFEIFPKEFFVNGEGGMKDVVGMQGGRLETEILALAGFAPYKRNLAEAVLDADLQILDIVPSPLAGSAAVLSQQEKELGVAVLDIGAGTSELAVYEEGDLIHLAIFPIGSSNITNDIAIGLKTDIDTAEMIKINCGKCISKGRDKKGKIETEGEEPLVFSEKMLTKIVDARVSEIFGEVAKELKKISKQGLLPAGIVLTGGGSKIPGILELTKKELKLPCRIGRPQNFSGIEDDPSFATVCGLVLNGVDLNASWGRSSGIKMPPAGEGIINKIKKFFKIFVP